MSQLSRKKKKIGYDFVFKFPVMVSVMQYKDAIVKENMSDDTDQHGDTSIFVVAA